MGQKRKGWLKRALLAAALIALGGIGWLGTREPQVHPVPVERSIPGEQVIPRG